MRKFGYFFPVFLTIVIVSLSFLSLLNVPAVFAEQESGSMLIAVSKPFLLSTNGKLLTKLTIGSPSLVSSNLTNLANTNVNCVLMVQIEDGEGNIVFKNFIVLTIPPRKTYTAGIMWVPRKAGNFTIKVWCQKDITDLTRISSEATSLVSIKKISSFITISTSPLKVKIGEKVSVEGKIKPPRKNVEVTIAYIRAGKVEVSHKVITASDGSFSDTFKPNLGGIWEIQASWPGDYNHEGAISRKVTVVVAKIPTSLKILPIPKEVEVGKKVIITGMITPPLAGIKVTLTYTKAGEVKVVHTVTTTSNGTFTDTIIPDAGGTWKVKASWKGDKMYASSESQELTFEAIEKRCIIATATYGSELAPQVQYLRGFRESIVYNTYAGSQFMKLFNVWYYSWSPYIASLIWKYPTLKLVTQVILYPLLGILYIATLTYTIFSFNSEIGIIVTGLITSMLIGLTYFTPLTMPVVVALRRLHGFRLKQVKLKLLLFVWLISLILLMIGEAFSPLLLTIASATFIILTIVLTVSITITGILNIRKLLKKS